LAKCYHCDKDIHISADRCPHCGGTFHSYQKSIMKAESTQKAMGCLMWLPLALAPVVGTIVLTMLFVA
jgi:hypothetical protein